MTSHPTHIHIHFTHWTGNIPRHQHPVSIGCSSSHLLSTSCLRVSATEPDPICLGPPQPPEAPSPQGLEHNSDSVWAEQVTQALPSQCPLPHQHIRPIAALSLHLASSFQHPCPHGECNSCQWALGAGRAVANSWSTIVSG